MPQVRRLSTLLAAPAAVLAVAVPAGAQDVPLPSVPALPSVSAPSVPAVAAPCADAALPPAASSRVRARAAVVCLLNRERAARGLRALRDRATLRDAAGRYARSMVVHDFFAHVSPGGSTLQRRAARAGYASGTLGENIAAATGADASPQAIVAAWMASSGHRRNILDPDYRDVGVGVASGMPTTSIRPAATYVADFGG
jgi:uncharacterized protein YkwD